MFCSVDGCDCEVYCRGLCVAHYFRQRAGDLRVDEPIGFREHDPICAIEGCDRKHYARGFCEMHYRRWKRRGEPATVIAPRGLKTCTVDGCANVAEAHGLCHGHYQRLM